MWNHLWNRYSRRQQTHRGRNIGGGGLLFSLLALLGWKNRERIRSFFREKFGREQYQDPMMPPPTV